MTWAAAFFFSVLVVSVLGTLTLLAMALLFRRDARTSRSREAAPAFVIGKGGGGGGARASSLDPEPVWEAMRVGAEVKARRHAPPETPVRVPLKAAAKAPEDPPVEQ